jgi:hypothetical protein
MKTIIINKRQINMLKEANNEITYYAFLSHIKLYLKKLLLNPISAQPDEFLKNYGLDGKILNSKLIDNNIIVKSEKIESSTEKDKFKITYKIPRKNFERKIKRLYISLFEQNIIDDNILNEDGCAGVMQGGGGNPNAGQFEQPIFGKPIRRKTIYVTQEQYDKLQNLKEETVMDTIVVDFGYDAPSFAKKGDPTLDHKNMIKKSFHEYEKKHKSLS